jgi:hypothetical protein
MADNYVTGPTTSTVQVLSPTQVIEVEYVPFVTKPSAVSAWRYVPIDAWTAEGASAWIEPLASAIEALISGGLASYAVMIEDVDPTTNLLTDYLEVTVSYASPSGFTSTTVVDVPATLLTLDTGFFGVLSGGPGGAGGLQSPADMLRAAYDQLEATANL